VSDWVDTTTTAVRDSLERVLSFIPEVIAALIVILIGVIVAWAVKTVVVRALGYIKWKKYTDALGLNRVFPEKVEVVELLGDLAKWTIIIIFLLPALTILNLDSVNEVINGILYYIPNVIMAVVIVMIGVVVADLAARVVRSTAATVGTHTAELLADIARWAIVVFAFLAALVQLEIAASLLQILWTGVVAFFVLAGGLAFGLGGRDAASQAIERVKKNVVKK
jgi:hypothetical protein